jgi:hypothetical protein
MNKLVVVTLAMVLVTSMAYSGVASNGLLLAKKSHESSDSNTGTSSSGHSGDSGGNSGSNDGNDGGTGTQDQKQNKGNEEINNPLHPGKDDNKDISDIPGENCSHGSCATPITPSHDGGGACIDTASHHCPGQDNPGNFHCHFLKDCIPHIPRIHNTVIVHTTKIIHHNNVRRANTVFVPGIGLVEPFNCKLNEDKGKINCEFVILKVV